MQFLSILAPLLLFTLAEAHFTPWNDARSCNPRECLLNNRCVPLMDHYTCCSRPSSFGHEGKQHHICPPSKSMHVCQYEVYVILITVVFLLSRIRVLWQRLLQRRLEVLFRWLLSPIWLNSPGRAAMHHLSYHNHQANHYNYTQGHRDVHLSRRTRFWSQQWCWIEYGRITAQFF